MLAKRISKITSSKTAEARNGAARLREQGISVINLTAGELGSSAPSEIQKAAIEAIRQNKNQYTETIGINQLRECIALQATKRIGLSYSKKHVAITHGAKQGLFNTMFALFNPGDKVIIPTPCWSTFVAQLLMLDVEPVFLDTTADHFQVTPGALQNVIDESTKGLILNTPNNPTGIVYTKENLRGIAKIVKDCQLQLVFDECYNELYHPGEETSNILALDPEIRDQTVVINSFSKSYAITGWRIGYVLGSEELIEGIKAIQSHSTSNPNSIAQHAVLPFLQEASSDFISGVRSQIFDNYQSAEGILNSIPHISYVAPKGAFYIFVNFSWYLENNLRDIKSIDDLCQFFLIEGHVAVVSGTAFYAPDFVRISISGAAQEVSEGIQRIKYALSKLSTRELAGVL